MQKIIDAMFGGSSASFARGFGIPKTTVHAWMKGLAVPSLANSMHIAEQASMSAADLLTNSTQSWSPPDQSVQLPLLEGASPRARRAPRTIDWVVIEQELRKLESLDQPISVIAAAEKLGVDHRQLYLRCNAATRALGERWKADKEKRRQTSVDAVTSCLVDLAESLAEDGRSITMREAVANVPRNVLNKVEGCWDVIRVVRQAQEMN